MSYGKSQQIERHMDAPKKGGEHRQSAFRQCLKKGKIKRERIRAKLDPECFPEYRKYAGWEY